MSAPTGTAADIAYAERNKCVALIARMALAMGLRVGTKQHAVEDAAWEDDWRTIVFIDLPTGQISWHFHDSEKELLKGLPEYPGTWDGHDTPTKYERVRVAFGAVSWISSTPVPFAAKLETDLAIALNQHCAENGSNTPDHILAQYLMSCLEAFNRTSRLREHWYGCHHLPGHEPSSKPLYARRSQSSGGSES